MNKAMWAVLGLVVGFAGGWFFYRFSHNKPQPASQPSAVEKPLLKYTIENLGKRTYDSEVVFDETVSANKMYEVKKFHFASDGKKVTGLAYLPIMNVLNPIIVQFRGYADQNVYYPGYGTEHTAQEFAKAGFITLAPDFLVYGGSDKQAEDVWESRFETYTTALNLLAAAKKIPMGNGKVGIWGHSNGGQITLTVLEISKGNYPAVVWAPVTAPFPYSILYYMNDNQEGDKQLRRKLFYFEDAYDADWYNLMNYTNRIQAPIQLDQGTADASVPVEWSTNFVQKLKAGGKDITYHIYPGADHNLAGAWTAAVQKDIEFFKQALTDAANTGNN
jgi:uncharacterized protein